jgi:hypothetical protein
VSGFARFRGREESNMAERLFLITAPQIEYIAACLRRMDEARNRLRATTSDYLDVCDELSKCSTAMHEVLNHLPMAPDS